MAGRQLPRIESTCYSRHDIYVVALHKLAHGISITHEDDASACVRVYYVLCHHVDVMRQIGIVVPWPQHPERLVRVSAALYNGADEYSALCRALTGYFGSGN